MQRAKTLNPWALGAVCALALLLAPAPNAQAGEGCVLDKEPQAAAEAETTTTAPTAGLRVVIDPETGELRAPTAEEGAALFGIPEGRIPEKSLTREPAIERPDGSLLMQFRGSFLKAAQATIGEDGKVVLEYHARSVPMPTHMVVNPPADPSQEADQQTIEEKE